MRVGLFVASMVIGQAAAFSSPRLKTGRFQSIPNQNGNQRQSTTSLSAGDQFDLSRPVFDLLALRSVRGDALFRYNALNQSEPIRINLFALLAFTLLAAPSLAESIGYDEMAFPQAAASVAASAVSAGLFVRECTRRSRQLNRIEKELNTETLPIRLPTNILSDKRFTDVATLSQLRALSAPPRIIAICGDTEKLTAALQSLSILSKRLVQASVYVVPVATDSSFDQSKVNLSQNVQWLADCYDKSVWKQYFNDLSEDNKDATFRWFGLTSTGRSFGSGQDEIPQWLQLLGQHLRPAILLDESDVAVTANAENEGVLKAQANFYEALINGNIDLMNAVCSSDLSPQVSEVVEAGGRIDNWEACLEEGARPADMQISGADAIIISATEAYTTNVEFPANTGMDTATLLAVQKWIRSGEGEDWKLQLHQTIPWSTETRAQGTLRCDSRGCVALTRGPERRTFGGIIG